ncbi:MAG TPA: tripartite tricarboxylate transporter TctB family protein [Spirochaetia bacterium]|nr:tripartite tricarboxylate transporter TctB family protein [Spirochaetia bacterium]
MKESNLPKADFLASIFLTLLGIFILIVSLNMPRFEGTNINPYSVPGIAPAFFGVVIVFMGLVLLIRSIRQGGHRLGLTGEKVAAFFKEEASRRIFVTLVISLIYGLVFLGRIPFVVATALYVLTFMIIFEYRFKESFISQWKRALIALILAVLVSGSVTAVFQYLFLVNLP